MDVWSYGKCIRMVQGRTRYHDGDDMDMGAILHVTQREQVKIRRGCLVDEMERSNM